MIRFYADESVNLRIVDGLRRRGADVLSAYDARLAGAADTRHLEFAAAEERTLVTADRDHLALADAWRETGRSHAGVIYYHPGWTSLGHVVREVHDLARALNADQARNRVLYVPRDRGPR